MCPFQEVRTLPDAAINVFVRVGAPRLLVKRSCWIWRATLSLYLLLCPLVAMLLPKQDKFGGVVQDASQAVVRGVTITLTNNGTEPRSYG